MRFLKIVLFSLFIFEESSSISLIRDAEIEDVLTEIVQPLFKVANLKDPKIFVVNSKEINAFTIGNGYIFVNSELILKCQNPLHLMGILAHETAHIAGNHINRLMMVIQSRSKDTAVAMLLGMIAAVISGSEKALAVSIGYTMINQRLFLKYSRGEEAAADNQGAIYLHKLGYDSECMVSVFEDFDKNSILNGGEYIPEYVKSHPNPKERARALRSKFSDSTKNLKKEMPADFQKRYARVLNKLRAYVKHYGMPLDKYGQAIYFHKLGALDKAISIMRSLLSSDTNNMFYKEYLAHLLFEKGNVKESINLYSQIYSKIKSVNRYHLIKKDYAEILIEANQNLDTALNILETLKYQDYYDEDIYRLLGKVYGKKNKIGISSLMLAYEQMILGEYDKAKYLAKTSLVQLNEKTEKSYVDKAKYLLELIKRAER